MRGLALSLIALLLAGAPAHAQDGDTATPVKHVIVLFQENVSFDHYFGTYPNAENRPGEMPFHAAPDTPKVNGLDENLLQRNPNAANPMRLSRAEAATCDMDHEYTAEQLAFDGGRMDKFVEFTGGPECDRRLVMAYYDGNTVTALWNYAQRFSLSDNFFGTTFGPSAVGAINLVAGNTHGASPPELMFGFIPVAVEGTLIWDPEPAYDDCDDPRLPAIAMTGRTIGDLLSAKRVSWGWFEGGFRATGTKDGKALCGQKSTNIVGAKVTDYSPHHEPFQYYKQTANPHHLPPTGKIGGDDQANHQYDLQDFYDALAGGALPAVSFVKAKKFQDGHAGRDYSNPLDEQTHLVTAIGAIMQSRYWADSAIVIAYDDSDGWYDHVAPPIVKGSAVPGIDGYGAPGLCGTPEQGDYQARCGHGPRLPLLIVSPFAKANYVDHTPTDQTSILKFIEDNWRLGRIGDQSYDALAGELSGMFDFGHPRPETLMLDPATGARR
jgi:phospholipase C